MGALVYVMVIVLSILVLSNIRTKSTFASARAHQITESANKVFGGDADATFSTFKSSVPNTDYVQYDDVKKLWETGQMTADDVELILR